MTDVEWLTCCEPKVMLHSLRQRNKLSDRKVRLFTAACCRRTWALLVDERSRTSVKVAEAFADGCASSKELTSAYYAANSACLEIDPVDQCRYASANLACAVAYSLPAHGCDCAVSAAIAIADTVADADANARAYEKAKAEEFAVQAGLVRDIFGNSFRPVQLDRSLRSPDVWSLARSVYDERAFDRLPILGDALEDAGCNNGGVLSHCREPGLHVRGCWVVDLILDKL